MPYGSSISRASAFSPHGHLRRFLGSCLACGAFCIAVSLVRAQSSGAPDIKLDPYSPSDRWSVTFTVLPSPAPQPYSNISDANLQAMQAIDTSYQAAVDGGSMLRDKQGEFQFTLYLNRTSVFRQEVYAYKIIENAYGSFNDLEGTVNVRLNSTDEVLGTVKVPLHCADGPPNALVVPSSDTPTTAPDQKVNMGSERDFSITLMNQMQLDAALGPATVQVSCGGCLQSVSAMPYPTGLAPGDKVQVSFKLNPNLAQAMHAAGAPNYLTLTIPVTAAEGGAQRGQQITIPIHFSPPPILTAFCVLLGTLLGGAIRAFTKNGGFNPWPWNEFILGLIYGALTWAVADFLYLGGTRVTLFTVPLDPTQLFQAALLCALAGAGPPVLKQLDNSALKSLPGGN